MPAWRLRRAMVWLRGKFRFFPAARWTLAALEGMLGPQTALICVMQVCNETGVIMPVKEICDLRDRLAPQAAIHVDGVQGYLRVPFSFKETKVDSYALSAHKIHGPKGVGALVLADGARIKPIVAAAASREACAAARRIPVASRAWWPRCRAIPLMPWSACAVSSGCFCRF